MSDAGLQLERLPRQAARRRDELEAVVEGARRAFIEAGKALGEIRDEKLYREIHETFYDYLRECWGFARSQGYRLIDAARVAEAVSPIGDITNEAQAVRALLADGARSTHAQRVARRHLTNPDCLQRGRSSPRTGFADPPLGALVAKDEVAEFLDARDDALGRLAEQPAGGVVGDAVEDSGAVAVAGEQTLAVQSDQLP